MWNRKMVKAQAKFCFKNNYWYSVLIAFLYGVLFVSSNAGITEKRDEITNEISSSGLSTTALIVIGAAILSAIGVITIVSLLIDIFIFNPLEVGFYRFFFVNQFRKAQFDEVGYGYRHNYMNMVFGILLKDLLITLGFMLFLIPGFILVYSYRFVPYILADDEYISATDALKKSRQMMNGNKWNAFIFDLSFIPWYLFSFITAGFGWLFWVSPYKKNADAQLYCAVKNAYFNNYYNNQNNQMN